MYTRIMRKYASILGIDKMSTSVIRLNDIHSHFLPGLTPVYTWHTRM